MQLERTLRAALFSLLLAFGLLFGLAAGLASQAEEASAADASLADTARLLGYMWGDGSQNANGVWDVNGPSGTSSLVEELVERHGGTFVDRERLRFRLPAPYDWNEWTNGLPSNSTRVRNAVQNPNFLAALLETEAAINGQIYDQSACCNNGYRVGRLTALRDLLRSQGYSTASITQFNDPNSGRVQIAQSEFAELRNNLDFVCPAANSDVRIPGGTDLGRFGNLDWLGAGSSWSSVIRTDCQDGRAVPPAPVPSGSCTATVSGNQLRVNWTYTLGDVVVRVNGQFVETVSGRDGSWTGRATGANNVELRVFAFNQRGTTSCRPGQGGGGGTAACTAVASGGRTTLTWPNTGAQEYQVRRNGSWVTGTTNRSITVEGSPQDSWVIRSRPNGVVVNQTCGGGGGTSPCTITARNSGVRVDWPGVAGVNEYQVRRNGTWIGEIEGFSRFDDRSGNVNADYEIRYWTGGQRFSINC